MPYGQMFLRCRDVSTRSHKNCVQKPLQNYNKVFSNITEDMKIMFGLKVLNIVSVLNIGENNTELQIVAKEKDRNGKEY